MDIPTLSIEQLRKNIRRPLSVSVNPDNYQGLPVRIFNRWMNLHPLLEAIADVLALSDDATLELDVFQGNRNDMRGGSTKIKINPHDLLVILEEVGLLVEGEKYDQRYA